MSDLPPSPTPPRLTVFGRGSYAEALRIGEILRKETVGGALLVAAAVVALIWANSPASESYFALRDFTIGYEPWHLDLSLGAWAADGLLAIFFFLVGLELKREFVAGDLRQPSKSIVPVAAAVGGVAVPALIYAAINLARPRDPARLGHPHRHGHRLRRRGAGDHRFPPSQRTAHFPADPRRRGRPSGDHHHRGLLHQRVPSRAAPAGPDPAGPLHRSWRRNTAGSSAPTRWPPG